MPYRSDKWAEAMGLIHNLEANCHLKGWYRGEKIEESRSDFKALRESTSTMKRRLMDLIGEFDTDKLVLETKVKELQDALDERYDYPRCGNCDNVKICGIHDCPSNPHYSEAQLCPDCGRCMTPQDEEHGGPCDRCDCKTRAALEELHSEDKWDKQKEAGR